MGKAKRNKTKRTTSQPTGVPSVREFEAQMEASSSQSGDHSTRSNTNQNAILSMIEKLQSPSADERECTCLTITNLIGQPGNIPQFLSAGIIRITGPLLLDASVGVRQASLGILRNMTVDGGDEVCDKMVEQDVMTPLVALIHKFGAEWTAEDKDKPEHDVFHQALHLLWNLCEASSTAVKIVNEQNLLPILLPCLLPSNHGYPMAVTAAQCVYTISEDNPEATTLLSTPDALQELNGLLTAQCHNTEEMLHKLLIAGILYNISSGEISSLGSTVLSHVIDLLVAILQHDVHTQIKCIAEFVETLDEIEEAPEGDGNHGSEGGDTMSTTMTNTAESNQIQSSNGDMESSMMVEGSTTEENDEKSISTQDNPLEIKHGRLDKMLTEARTLITAQQLAVEMVANFCCSGDDDGWESADISDSGSDDISSDNGDDAMQNTEDESLCLPSEIQKAFVASGVIAQVFEKLKEVNADLSNILSANSQSKIVQISYDKLLLRALLCTSNLVDAVEADDLGGASVLQQLWTMLSGLTQTATNTLSLDLLEAATTALRAVVGKLEEIESPLLQEIKETDLQFLFNLGTQCTHREVRVNAVRITSTIGCCLVEHDPLTELQLLMLKGVGEFLCHVVSSDTEVIVVAEALDAMYDVFAEDKTDPVVKELGLVAKLQELVPVLKKKVQQQRKQLGLQYPVVSTAKTNLVRFIKYKASRPSAVSPKY